MSHESKDPFDKKGPRFSWRELAVLAGLISAAVTAWAGARSEISDLQKQQLETKHRVERAEDAIGAIPVMRSDISWIRLTLENQERRGNR